MLYIGLEVSWKPENEGLFCEVTHFLGILRPRAKFSNSEFPKKTFILPFPAVKILWLKFQILPGNFFSLKNFQMWPRVLDQISMCKRNLSVDLLENFDYDSGDTGII